jgi:Domain of unknown function (DUF222)/HNH endonuclease
MFGTATALAHRPLELIEREIESLAAQVNASHARWLELVREFDRREGWAGSGCRSTSEWIAWRCALNPRSAREHVRVAKALGGLPAISAEFERGRLSYSKVRALTRIANDRSEEDLLELARHATAAQLERIVRATRRVTAAEADQQYRDSYVRFFWDDDDGSLRIDAKLPPDDGALFLRALEAARDTLHELYRGEAAEAAADRGSAEPQEPAEPPRLPTNAEALVVLSEAMLMRPPSGLTGGERYQVLVHVDSETLASRECAIADGPGIAPETARRLACDASLVTLVERNGEPLSVGRRTRSIPPAIRRALVARDGRCQFPGCERRRFVDAHHIRHWAHGGETRLENLVLLCRHHHRHVHEGGHALIRGPGGQIEFRRPDGALIARVPTPVTAAAELPVTSAGPLLTGAGEAMDLRACVDAALDALGASDADQARSSPGALEGKDADAPGADAGDPAPGAPDR